MALLLITHDLGIVRKMADRVCVMQARPHRRAGHGRVGLRRAGSIAYTRRLLAARAGGRAQHPAAADAAEVMAASDLKVWFPRKAGLIPRTVDHIKAVDGVTLSVREGHTVGVVGESGSGKTTLGLALLRLLNPARAGRLSRAGASTGSRRAPSDRCGGRCRWCSRTPMVR